ncbi:MAG: nuclear transport factor 2 family protein [Rubrivivax sp.]|nr:nuclear transport factor 2 family protein [Rubrivivax sp.]
MSSRTPLEVVQSVYAAFGRGDVAALLGDLAPDVHWRFVGAPGTPYSGSVIGHEGVQKFLGGVAAHDDIRAFEPREFFPGGEHVTVLGWEDTVARTTGRRFQADWVHVFEVKGGRITRFFGMYDTAPAAQAFAS